MFYLVVRCYLTAWRHPVVRLLLKRFILLLFMLLLSSVSLPGSGGERAGEGAGETTAHRGTLTIMWYNVENLFHPGDDSLAGDDPFTPGGDYHWTMARYGEKLAAIAKVIIAAGEWDPPGVVGLCEVENAEVLEELVSHPLLADYGYSFVHGESPDHRGMDVACLYREGEIELLSWSTYASVGTSPERGTRDMLHFCGTWGKGDTLDLFLVHLISKYSGAGTTAGPRRSQAEQLVQLADSVYRLREGTLVVIAGDFNDEPGTYAMEPLTQGLPGGDTLRNVALEGGGSYKYRGRWEMIDRFMVCGAAARYRITGNVLRLPALLVPDEAFGGSKPFRSYSGQIYNGGISDHLPLTLEIRVPPFSGRFSE